VGPPSADMEMGTLTRTGVWDFVIYILCAVSAPPLIGPIFYALRVMHRAFLKSPWGMGLAMGYGLLQLPLSGSEF